MALKQELAERLGRHGQEHLLQHWDDLDDAGREALAAEVGSIDFDQLDRLVAELVRGDVAAQEVRAEQVEPIEVVRMPQTDGERAARRRATDAGEEALSAGEVAIVVVAGGSGTRLGFAGPKGTFPIGPVSSASLFQIHAEKVVALGRRYGKQPSLYVMTSPENHEVTADFFERHDRFGLDHVRFFKQGQMPAVDLETGKVLLADRGRVAMSPDGHGGTLAALNAPGHDGCSPSCLAEMGDRGVRSLFYFQVDNPMVEIADPTFIGLHRQAEADMSFKVVEKMTPDEKVGVVVLVDGKPQVIEYSDLPAALAEKRGDDGQLAYWAGSIAIHVLECSFIQRLVGVHRLPFHRAVKKVPYLDAGGAAIKPEKANAVKFEQFIFDALPESARYVIVETDRTTEFEPLKNAVGPDSPATVHQRMSDLFGGWLEQAGAVVPRRADGSVPFAIEISPLFALDAQELKSKVEPGLVVERPIYLR